MLPLTSPPMPPLPVEVVPGVLILLPATTGGITKSLQVGGVA